MKNETKKIFDDAHVADSVYSRTFGNGKVIETKDVGYLTVEFGSFLKDFRFVYLKDGRMNKDDIEPDLYWSKPTVTGGTTPPKRMVKIGQYEYPEPEREALKVGFPFYTPLIKGCQPSYERFMWEDSVEDLRQLSTGNVHASSANAVSHAKAKAMAIKDLEKYNNQRDLRKDSVESR